MPRVAKKKSSSSAKPRAKPRVYRKSSSKSSSKKSNRYYDFYNRNIRPAVRGALAGAGSVVGGALGSYQAGREAGLLLGRITGLGEYKYKRNSLAEGEVPVMHSSKDGVRIRHREFIQDLSGSVAFANTSFAMNPGLPESFPWLSAIAQNFEEYRWEGLVFEFKSTSADALNSTNTALGTVILSSEYNVTQPAYVNKQQMENSMWAMSVKPSCDAIMPVECEPHLNPLANQYIRTGAVASGQDARLYDLCNVQVATVGMQAAAVIGELWVSYDVVLMKPQLDSGLGLALNSAHYKLNSVAVTTAYFGTSQTSQFDSIGLSFTGTVCTLPIGLQGNYFISYYVLGTSASVSDPTFTYVNGTELKIWLNDASTRASNTGDTATNYLRNCIINIPNPNIATTITLSGGTLPTAATAADFMIYQVNGNISN